MAAHQRLVVPFASRFTRFKKIATINMYGTGHFPNWIKDRMDNVGPMDVRRPELAPVLDGGFFSAPENIVFLPE